MNEDKQDLLISLEQARELLVQATQEPALRNLHIRNVGRLADAIGAISAVIAETATLPESA